MKTVGVDAHIDPRGEYTFFVEQVGSEIKK